MSMQMNIAPLSDRLTAMMRQTFFSVEGGASRVAGEMESVAKRDAPWTDRTGNARRTMTGFTQWEDEDTLLIGLSGHMSYSPLLELYYGERYAIILPTVDSYAPRIVKAVAAAALTHGGLSDE